MRDRVRAPDAPLFGTIEKIVNENTKQPPEQFELCLTPNCGKKVERRGLCRSCYIQALRLIHTEKTTWMELQDMGLGLATKRSKQFMLAFLKKKQAMEASQEASATVESIATK